MDFIEARDPVILTTNIPELEKFYEGSSVAKASKGQPSVIECKITSLEAKGQWFIKQFKAEATTLGVGKFITNRRQGGISIPEIADLESYTTVFCQEEGVVAEAVQVIKPGMFQLSTVESISDELQMIQERMITSQVEITALQDKVANPGRRDAAGTAAVQRKLDLELIKLAEDKESLRDMKVEYRAAVKEEEARQVLAQGERGKRMAERTAAAQKKHMSDREAHGRLMTCLDYMKQWIIAHLQKSCQSLEVICRTYVDGEDPLEVGNIRAVFFNLNKHFRNSTEIGVASASVRCFRDALLTVRSLPEHIRAMEAMAAAWEDMGFTTASRDPKTMCQDILSMVFIAGMTEKERNAFMEAEDTAVEVTTRISRMMLGRKMSDEDGDEMAALIQQSRANATMYQRLVSWCKKHENQKHLQGSFDIVKSDKHIKDTAAKQRQAVEVFSTTHKGVCYDFQRGKCTRGAGCRFEHRLVSAESAEKGGSRSWKQGEATPAPVATSASTTASANNEQPKSQPKKVEIASALKKPPGSYTMAFGNIDGLSSGESSPTVNVMLTAAVRQGGTVHLGWDTHTMLHIATNINVMDNPVQYKGSRPATGIGGSAVMTHIGHSSLFNLPRMRLIESPNVPNLKSIGRAVQPDHNGDPGLAIFGDKGAVQVRAQPHILEQFNRLIEQCEREGLVEGTAAQRNFVYTEEFENGPRVAAVEANELEEGTLLVAAAAVHLFAGRVKMDGAAAAVDLLAKAGLSQETLLEAATKGIIEGLPDKITPSSIKKYFTEHGPDEAVIEAGIKMPTRRKPKDWKGIAATQPGEILMVDNMDVPFARVETPVEGADPPRTVLKPVRSIHGYRDVVMAVDEYTGFAFATGRVTKKNPHQLIADLIDRWKGRWHSLRSIKCDAEFVTKDILQLAAAEGLQVYQAPPGVHAMVQGGMEGRLRWIGDAAQANMNRLPALVAASIITEGERAKLWYHAILHATMTYNLKLVGGAFEKGMTRLEAGTGKKTSLSTLVLLPFGLPIIGKRLRNDGRGRGMRCLYLGASTTVPGGALVYDPCTKAVSVLYQFTPLPAVTRSTLEEQLAAARLLYLGLEKTARAESGELGPGSERDSARLMVPWPEQGLPLVETAPAEIDRAEPLEDDGPAPAAPSVDRTKLPYQTRNVRRRVLAVEAEDEENVDVALNEEVEVEKADQRQQRPPKPEVPCAKVREQCPRWQVAFQRETDKLNEEDTFGEIPLDDLGKEILPEDVMFQHLIEHPEFKWKVDPETGEECWLECVRIVCDGSVDQRPNLQCYAETPERTLLFLTLGLSATTGEHEASADVERAYLNAPSLDKNIVIIASPAMVKHGLKRRSLLQKGLYGGRKASLGWEIYIDCIMISLGWKKLDICRGMYRKDRADGKIARALRHSDDIKVSAKDLDVRIEESELISSKVRMSPWKPVTRFLGVEIERVSSKTGLPDPTGDISLIRQREKITNMGARFGYLRAEYNPKNRVRWTPGPVNPLRDEAELPPEMRELLDKRGQKTYQELTGCVIWIVNARPDVKHQSLLLSRRGIAPSRWDMSQAVWVMDYLTHTVVTPLVLGGPVLDPQATSDSSFATMPERKTVIGCGVTTGPLSGALEVQSRVTKAAMTSVYETELTGAVVAAKTEEFITHACEELGYEIPAEHKVFTDNQGVLLWTQGNTSNSRSRHVDIGYHYLRHAERDGRITMRYVPTKENYADLLTKALGRGEFWPMAARILGHLLVQGLGIPGIFEVSMSGGAGGLNNVSEE